MISKKSVQCVIDHNKKLMQKDIDLYESKKRSIDKMNMDGYQLNEVSRSMSFLNGRISTYKSLIEDLEDIIKD